MIAGLRACQSHATGARSCALCGACMQVASVQLVPMRLHAVPTAHARPDGIDKETQPMHHHSLIIHFRACRGFQTFQNKARESSQGDTCSDVMCSSETKSTTNARTMSQLLQSQDPVIQRGKQSNFLHVFPLLVKSRPAICLPFSVSQ